MKRIAQLLFLIALALPARAAITFDVITNVPASEMEFTNAFYTLGTTGQKVLIQIGAGSFTLNTTITHSRNLGLSLRGAGMANTTITGPGSTYGIIYNNSASTNEFVISDLNLIGNASQTGGFISIGANVGTKYHAWYEITRIRMTNCVARGFSLGFGDAFGYVHHCQFEFPNGAANFNAVQFGGNAQSSWLTANPIGTTNFVYWMYNTHTNRGSGAGNGFFDCYNGAQEHVEGCNFDGDANTGAHGYDSQLTSARVGILRSNTWTSITSAKLPIEWRGGTLWAIGNTGTGTVALDGFLSLSYYRDCWGAYQSGLGYPGIAYTNWFSGIAVAATASSLTASNFPSGTNISANAVQLDGNAATHGGFYQQGLTLTITGGTGSGQVRIISDSSLTSQSVPGRITFTVSTNWSVTPDATSTFEIGFTDGSKFSVGNLPQYTFVATTNQFISLVRQVLVGANLNGSLDNLMKAVNRDPTGAGLVYSAFTTNAVTGQNYDFLCLGHDSKSITWTNILDGPNGYPGAMQPGVIGYTPYTNTGVTLMPCLSVGNVLNGTNNINFGLKWQLSSCSGPTFIDDVQNGRDYYVTNAVPIAPVTPQTMLADPPITLSASVASTVITNTSDLNGVTSVVTPGVVNYIAGESVTFTAPATSGGHSFIKWTLNDGTLYSTNASISLTISNATTFIAVYDTYVPPRSQAVGRTQRAGRTIQK